MVVWRVALKAATTVGVLVVRKVVEKVALLDGSRAVWRVASMEQTKVELLAASKVEMLVGCSVERSVGD